MDVFHLDTNGSKLVSPNLCSSHSNPIPYTSKQHQQKKTPHARGEVAYPPFPSSFCFILDNSLQTFNTRTFVSFRLKRIIPDSWLEEIIVR